ncbi:ATP-binding protein [Legionella maceachernii]|uniref:histidine kinase n=1 Tax=Legionella maceachernii TaxID=466 RepID=A0A0W0WBE3_9GAMM|nr:ATP-binding protein [Legionella maceachernii]KTD29681.1 sensory box histidine kinase/response regulator [Legionella maceachernii]SKA21074.1 PAS domain S-box-containing protein [Legionella maceachernii]SUP02584.1 Aerobic respiration control sensor protein ArcB [Legionella maceachernii]
MDVILQGAINLVFSVALFINALLFIPQAIKIFKEKSALGLSMWTFTGFLLTQLAAILYGVIHGDAVLTIGYLLSLITCGIVVALALIYKTSQAVISFEEILKQLPSQVYWKDTTGRYIWRNDASLKYFGLANNGESRNKTDEQLFSENIAATIREVDNEVLKGAIKITEEPLLSALGIEKSYLTYRIPLKNKGSEIVGLLGISFDVTEFKKVFMQQLHTLEHIIAMMPGNVYWVNKENVYQGCNDNQAKLSGLISRKEIIGKRNVDLPWNLKAGALPNELDAINTNVMETGEVIVVEEPATLSDGSQLMYLSTKAPIRNEKEDIIGMVGISVDITDRKEMEINLREAMIAAQAASRAKSEFIANISHDLRTPLTGVVTMADDLKDRLIGLGGEQEAKWLHNSGVQLLEFCNNILDSVSADNYTEQDLKEECFDLRQLIQAVGNLEMPMIKSKGLNFISNVDPNSPSYIVKDEAKLYRILLNLLGNAIKFTENGNVSIDVNLIEQDDNNVTLKFCVTDTGIGIKSELQDQIFDRFFRADPSYKGVYKGNGLGLYIAQKYVQLLGGERIYLESEEGKGSRFFFALSFKLGEQKDAVQIVSEQDQRPQQVGQISSNVPKTSQSIEDSTLSDDTPLLLLIEDNKPALLGLQSMVKRAGCRFKSAEDGEKAVELAKTHHFDLIISDIGLPGISGIEATKAIRAWENENHKEKVPIVALTGHAAQMAEPECLQAGMDKVLTKPATFDQIKNLIQEFISNNEKVDSKNTQQEPSLPPQTGLGRDLPDTEEELFMLDQYPYFSMKVVTEIYGENCHKLVEESLNSMSDLIPKDKEEIKEAFLAKNWDRVEELAHRMKGGAAYAGTVRMKYACQYLERYRKAGHSKSLEKLYYQLIQVVDETKNYIDKWLKMNREV